MPPSNSIKSRINAFENLGASTSVSTPRSNGAQHTPPNLMEEPISPQSTLFSPMVALTPTQGLSSKSPSPSPPNLGRKSSLIDLQDWIVDDDPQLPQNGWGAKLTNGKAAKNRNVIGRIGSPPQRGWSNSSAPLINLESPPKPRSQAIKVPPIPPRKPSYNSIKFALNSSTNGSNALRPPGRSDSLTVEQHTYPPLGSSDGARKGPGHVPASSISSFHSVSLSSDGGGNIEIESPSGNFIATFPMDRQHSGGDSLDESYENVSHTSATSPTTTATLAFDWERAMGKAKAKQLGGGGPPPKLPQRPSSLVRPPPVNSPPTIRSPPPRSVPTSPKIGPRTSSSSSIATTTRRAAPSPPPNIIFQPRSSRTSLASTTASDRSSVMSTATTTSRTSASTQNTGKDTSNVKLSRPTPVPALARKRYDSVFVANVVQRRKAEKVAAKKKDALLSPPGTRKSRAAAGWRGLSVDLITNPEAHQDSNKENDDDEVDESVSLDERMDAFSIKLIWSASKLEKDKLKAIWSECDTSGQGSLDRNSFAKGMWRIDEELRRAQFTHQTSRRASGPPTIKRASATLILR